MLAPPLPVRVRSEYVVRDPKRLARLLVISELTTRELAAAAGYKAHSYIVRLVRGESRGVSEEAAHGIAGALGVDVEDLFVPSVSTDDRRNAGRGSTA